MHILVKRLLCKPQSTYYLIQHPVSSHSPPRANCPGSYPMYSGSLRPTEGERQRANLILGTKRQHSMMA